MDEITLLLKVCRFDIFAITETFLDESISDKQLHVENYKFVRRDRNTGQDGGGCLIYIASHICYSRLKSLESPDVELIWINKFCVNMLRLLTVFHLIKGRSNC